MRCCPFLRRWLRWPLARVMLLFLKVNPIEAYAALWDGAFGSSNAFAETLVKATPLLLVASESAFLFVVTSSTSAEKAR